MKSFEYYTNKLFTSEVIWDPEELKIWDDFLKLLGYDELLILQDENAQMSW